MKQVVGAISILSYQQFIVNAAILHFRSVLLFGLMWVGMRGFRNSHQGMAGRGGGGGVVRVGGGGAGSTDRKKQLLRLLFSPELILQFYSST